MKRLNFLFNLLFSLLIISIVILLIGKNPLDIYIQLFKNVLNNYEKTLIKAIILALTSLAFSFAMNFNLFNIAVQGEFILGAIVSNIIFLNLNYKANLLLAMLIAGLAGSVMGLTVALLKLKFNMNEAISSIILNYFIFNLQPLIKNSSLRTGNIKIFILMLLLVALVYWLIIEKDILRLRALNKNYVIIFSLLASGFIAALGGIIKSFSNDNIFLSTEGFDGIVVSVLGKNTIGIILTSFLFSALKVGSINLTIPSEVILIFQSIFIFLSSLPKLKSGD